MRRALYAGGATLAAPGLRWWLNSRARAGKERPDRLAERRGIETTPRPAGQLLWLHAASVGEATSVLPVVASLARMSPDTTMLLTTGTVTSATLLEARLPAMGVRALHRFAPLDVPAWAARFLDHWRPDAAAFVESEIWPNQLAACAARAIPVMLVNARLSTRSLARWQFMGRAGRAVFAGFTAAQAQSEEDAARLRAVGLRDIAPIGNLKFAAPPLPVDLAELHRLETLLGDRPRWLAASTHPGEEPIILAAHAQLRPHFPGLLTIIVPRHPSRGSEIGQLARRAANQDPPADAGIWIGDTLGELGLYYRLASHAFIGASLVPKGGQSPIEAARLGRPTAIGPHASNQRQSVELLQQAGALAPVTDAASLAAWSASMLRDPAARQRAAEAGIAAVDRAADLPDQVAARLLDLAR